MKIRRNTGGYTLLELTMVVAILGILMGLSAIGIRRHQRTLTQVEYDGIAREIFVAAQNHLTMAESQGLIDIPDKTDALEVGFPYDADKGIYYYVVNDTLRNELKASGKLNMLDLMLPVASVDGTARLGGSYVILYQMEPAVVLDVFYASAKDGRFHHMFKSDEVELADLIMSYSGVQNYRSRQYYQYINESNNEEATTVIGWYGVGADSGKPRVSGDSILSGDLQPPVPKGEHLNPPIIRVVNAERLYVEVINPNTSEDVAKAGVRLVITGEQSGKTCVIPLHESNANSTSAIPANFSKTLDDVTSEDEHFYNVCGELYPGEDITVYAEVYNNVELTNTATSASVTTNSLFASLDKGTSPLLVPATAKISNFRHLENLDNSISNITIFDETADGGAEHNYYYRIPAGPDKAKKPPIQINHAQQISDMDWVTFWDKLPQDGRAKIYDYNRHDVTKNKNYFPVTNGGTIAYDGQGHTISNVSVNASAEAGLFATLGHESTVSNLQLVNFDVTSTGGAAGALAGVLRDGSTVSGVLAHGKDSAVTGKTSVGGLIGAIAGADAVKVAQSAAAVYVTSTGGDAGGLIGAVAADAGATVTVTDSYAGGHVITVKDAEGNETGVKYDETSCNVDAAGSAGGLIGSGQGSLTVKNCYATTSVKGATAGGFVGSVTNDSITKCYATGYVTGTGNKGAFAGESSATLGNDGYFAVVNEEQNLSAVGTGSNTGVTNWDGFDGGGFDGYGAGKAKPYDSFLKNYYKGMYTFKTIGELANYDDSQQETAPEWMTTHYGDWPALDTLVINEK